VGCNARRTNNKLLDVARTITYAYSRAECIKNRVGNVLYCSVSEFICRAEEINEQSQHKIRFSVREKHIKKASCWRRKLSLSGKIYRPERKIIQESQALTFYLFFFSLRRWLFGSLKQFIVERSSKKSCSFHTWYKYKEDADSNNSIKKFIFLQFFTLLVHNLFVRPLNFSKGRDTHSHIDIKMAMSSLLSLIYENRQNFLHFTVSSCILIH
jgi:hypothetical protein